MTHILIAIIAGVILEIVFYKVQDESDSLLAGVLMAVLGVALGVAILAYAFAGFNWFAAEHKANIINREYGTNYTAQEVFWASDVVETIQQINRERYELNGNLFGNYFNITAISGNVADLPTGATYYYFGITSISGDVADLPTGATYYYDKPEK